MVTSEARMSKQANAALLDKLKRIVSGCNGSLAVYEARDVCSEPAVIGLAKAILSADSGSPAFIVYHPCWQCQVCGHVWPAKNPDVPPARCPSRKCFTFVWRGNRKSQYGRPDKSMTRARQLKYLPAMTASGKHHSLCPCILCLTTVSQERKSPAASPKKRARTPVSAARECSVTCSVSL